MFAAAGAGAQSGEALLQSKGCLGCHAIDSQKVGPALKDVAAKYKNDKKAEAKLVAVLKEGKGHPVKAEATDAELKAMVGFVLSAQAGPKTAAAPLAKPDNAVCLDCHGNQGFGTTGDNGKARSLHVRKERFGHSVHGKRLCVECHKDITEIPHQKGVTHKVSCVTCHDDLWKAAQKEGKTGEHARLGVVVQQIDRYMKSVHARPNREDQSRTNATCYNCHDAHYVYPLGTTERAEWRLSIPDVCGKCHVKEHDAYETSVHGREVIEKRNPAAAICSDCHTTHDIESPEKASTKLAIVKNCGGCHVDSFRSYTGTYHGQVDVLGYTHTAKCYDCHGSHAVQRVSDPASTVHPDNRLATCRRCHTDATPGFASFQPHATTHDLERYPQLWLSAKFMIGLLAGTFAFFWTHTALWFYREYAERKQRKTRQHVLTSELPQGGGKHYQRFPILWRVAHLLFALSLMVLTLTGMAVLYAESSWAPVVINALGGTKIAAIVHRTAAAIFASIFFAHLVYVIARIARTWNTFHWLGPRSMIPNWQDIKDIFFMFRWFLGKGPRPVFDRWTYWEKFDYWAPFWGVTIIGVSGVMMWFPALTASVLPGWVFNVAMLVHGEEALLAVLFLFTVHFFNNHFRPDKFPLDVVMFTGSMPVEEFRREHTVEYDRLVETGELQKYLVDAPSRPMALGSKILGFTLIAAGLTLLLLVLVGFMSSSAQAQPATVKPAPRDDLRAVYATAQDVAEGRNLAESACVRCHGANGVSASPGIPHLAGQRAAYLHLQLRAYRDGGRAQSPMGGAVKFLSEEALVKVAAYFASLEPPRPAPARTGKPAAARPDPVQAGKAAAAACAGCHGEDGVSKTPGMPSLVALEPKYFVSAMGAYRKGQRKNEMMKPFAAAIAEGELENVALFYALQKPARAQTPAQGDPAAGKIAAASCAGCHGDRGVSTAPGTPGLAGQDAQYLAAATLAYKDGTRADDAMKGVAAALDERNLRDIAAYYAAQPPQALNVRKPMTLSEWAERCDRCHGVNGNSTDPLVPALAAQRADWLEQVLNAYRTGARKSSAMAAMSASLTEAEVREIAAHYARQSARPVTYILVPPRPAR
jgi:cytochrome c553/cytochrome b subunit of formate dehydrogenase